MDTEKNLKEKLNNFNTRSRRALNKSGLDELKLFRIVQWIMYYAK